MFEIIFLLVLGLFFLLFVSVQDLKTTEISSWAVLGVIFFALGFRLFFCIFAGNGFGFFYSGLIGLGIFFILGNLLYYLRVFAGGDANLMFALGAILPLFGSFSENLRIFVLFFLVFLFVGAFYGIVASIIFSSKNFKKFKQNFPILFRKNKILIFVSNVLGLLLMVFGFEDSFLFVMGILIFILPYLYVFSKTIDDFCMVKKKKPEKLMEGDWLTEDIKIGNKLIKAKWEGLSMKEIKFIQKAKKNVVINMELLLLLCFLLAF